MKQRYAFFGAAIAAAFLASAPTALQAQGYDLGGIQLSHPDWFVPGSPTYNPEWALQPGAVTPPYPYAHPYAYGCPRQLVPVRLRNGRVVMRWMRAC
jgi:hypothetical protein